MDLKDFDSNLADFDSNSKDFDCTVLWFFRCLKMFGEIVAGTTRGHVSFK